MSGVWEEYADTDMMEMGFGGGGTIVDILKQHRLRVGETLAMKNGELGYYSSRVYSEGKVWETIIYDDGDPEYVLVDNPVFEERFDRIDYHYQTSSSMNYGLLLSAMDLMASDYASNVHNHSTYSTTKGITKDIYKSNGEYRSARAARFGRLSKFVSRSSIALSIASTTYAGMELLGQYKQGGVKGIKVGTAADFGVGVVGLGTTAAVALGLVSNPVGWVVGTGILIYSGVRLVNDIYNEE